MTNSYIIDTRYAASELIRLISNEEQQLVDLKRKLDSCKNELERRYNEFLRSEFDMDDNMTDTRLQYTYGKYFSYMQEVVAPLEAEIKNTETSLEAKSFSICSLSGALLQIAKQGISIVHGSLANCPDGRTIGDETLKNVIWHARNQSLHFEEGNYRLPVVECFKTLENDFGLKFNLSDKNLSKDIVDLLGWKDYSVYESDMVSLLK